MTTRSLLVIALGGFLVSACNRDAVANQAAEKASSTPAEAAQPVSNEAKGRFDESTFTLSIVPKTLSGKGSAGELLIVLEAKAPFHVNGEYPHRFRVTSARGLTTLTETIQRDPARVTPSKLELSVPVTLGQAGPFGLTGEMSFSVCTDEKCLMEKRRLAADFEVK